MNERISVHELVHELTKLILTQHQDIKDLIYIQHQNQHKIMAQLSDVQASTDKLTAEITNLSTAITNYQAAHAGDITPAQADGIVSALDSATASLTALAATITVPTA